ncbi:MAG: gas vesicle protein K [Candidatus Rokubacteria bacterium]|nr:gas vesicle protein K [Candidatus Rokubacteria bacterium]
MMQPKTLSVPEESSLAEFEGELERLTEALPRRINSDPEKVEQGLAKLVLTLIELLRQLLEKQAVRRIEAGSLTPEEIERMGVTFLRLEEKMVELRALFGLTEEDLNLSLGPLGDLL